MQILKLYFLCVIAILILVIVIVCVARILRSPFRYPYFEHYFDVSGKRNPQMEDLIDEYLNSGNFNKIQKHNQYISRWEKECQEQIQKSIMKKYRRKQFEACLDDSEAFRFYFTRKQTRYRQRDYCKRKTEYKGNRSKAVEHCICLPYEPRYEEDTYQVAGYTAGYCGGTRVSDILHDYGGISVSD